MSELEDAKRLTCVVYVATRGCLPPWANGNVDAVLRRVRDDGPTTESRELLNAIIALDGNIPRVNGAAFKTLTQQVCGWDSVRYTVALASAHARGWVDRFDDNSKMN